MKCSLLHKRNGIFYPNLQTKAVEKQKEWTETGFLKDADRTANNKGREITYIPDKEKNIIAPKKGRRLDKLLISPILC